MQKKNKKSMRRTEENVKNKRNQPKKKENKNKTTYLSLHQYLHPFERKKENKYQRQKKKEREDGREILI